MIIQSDVLGRGKELDISNGSHLFYRDETGEEIYKEWSELDEETQAELSKLAVQAEELLERGAGIIDSSKVLS